MLSRTATPPRRAAERYCTWGQPCAAGAPNCLSKRHRRAQALQAEAFCNDRGFGERLSLKLFDGVAMRLYCADGSTKLMRDLLVHHALDHEGENLGLWCGQGATRVFSEASSAGCRMPCPRRRVRGFQPVVPPAPAPAEKSCAAFMAWTWSRCHRARDDQDSVHTSRRQSQTCCIARQWVTIYRRINICLGNSPRERRSLPPRKKPLPLAWALCPA